MSNPFKADSLGLTGISIEERDLIANPVDGQIIYLTHEDAAQNNALSPARYEYYHAGSTSWYEINKGPGMEYPRLFELQRFDDGTPKPITPVGNFNTAADIVAYDQKSVAELIENMLYRAYDPTTTSNSYTNGTLSLADDVNVATAAVIQGTSLVEEGSTIDITASGTYSRGLITPSTTVGQQTISWEHDSGDGTFTNSVYNNDGASTPNAISRFGAIDRYRFSLVVDGGAPLSQAGTITNGDGETTFTSVTINTSASVSLEVDYLGPNDGSGTTHPDGSNIAYDSNGNIFEAAKASGTLTGEDPKTISASNWVYYYNSGAQDDADVTTWSKLWGNTLKPKKTDYTDTNTADGAANGLFDFNEIIDAVNGDDRYAIAYPPGNALTGVDIWDSLVDGGSWQSDLSNWSQDSTQTFNNGQGVAITYTIWRRSGDVQSSTTKFRFTL